MTEQEPQKTVAKLKRKRKKKSLVNYIILFFCVFAICVIVFLSGIKSYTPVADVDIGNNESMTMNENDLDFEIKSVDERLRWIQMEDDLPTVAVRNSKADTEFKRYTPDTTTKLEIEDEDDKPVVKEVIPTPGAKKSTVQQPQPTVQQTPVAPKPTINEVASTQQTDFRTAQVPKQVIPLPTQAITYTKVYLGNYSSLEEAMAVQKRINMEFPEISAFIKATNNYYLVQLGSFADKEKANQLITQLKVKGYNPKTL